MRALQQDGNPKSQLFYHLVSSVAPLGWTLPLSYMHFLRKKKEVGLLSTYYVLRSVLAISQTSPHLTPLKDG